jgi:nicotinamide-nucleotide amidase
MASKSVVECCEVLIKKNWTICFVESASAGKISYEFSTVMDSGKILIGGLVCYHESMKEDLLLIPKGTIEKYTAEYAVVTNICVALTGLTTPGGSESPTKPVGTIFLHFIFPHTEIAKKYRFKGTPEEIVQKAIDAVAALVSNEAKNN